MTLEEKAKQFAHDWVYPVKGLTYSWSLGQENSAMYELLQDVFKQGANWQTATSSTRIAELQARVAELEGVLKEINKELFTWVIDSNPIKFEHYQKASELATNALKNQQP